jgi:HPt (histidine-containing phosphotransfer) domain-containing protein
MQQQGAPRPVVFDPTAVASLTGHPDDPTFARVFVARYRTLLPTRLGRIARSLREHDLDEALDATLSLKVSSSTLGAGELEGLGARLEGHLRRLDLAAAGHVARQLPAAAARVDVQLAAYLAA